MTGEANSELISLFEDEKFTFTGNLSDIALPRIFYHLRAGSMTGLLTIQKESSKKAVSFENGYPRFIMSNIVEECLGRIFVSKGKITEKQCEESLNKMRATKKKQGEILVDMGLLEPHEIDEGLKAQARERIIELFSWIEGDYTFFEQRSLRKDLISIDIEVPQIVLLGIRRYYTLEMLKSKVDKFMNNVPVLVESKIFMQEEFKFATWESKTLKNIDGISLLKIIIEKRLTREIDVYHLVYALACLEVLKFVDIESAKRILREKISEKSKEIEEKRLREEKRKKKIIELTKDFVVKHGDEKKKRKRKKKGTDEKEKPFPVWQSAVAAVVLIIIVIFMFSGGTGKNYKKLAGEGVLHSAEASGTVLNLMCTDEWGASTDKGKTRNLLEDIRKKVKKNEFRKVILRDKGNRILGSLFMNPSGKYYIEIY